MEKPVIWILSYLLGWSITGLTYLKLLDTPIGNDIFNSMPAGFKYSIYFFSCVFLLINCMRLYEKYRKDKIENDEAEMILRDKKALKKQ